MRIDVGLQIGREKAEVHRDVERDQIVEKIARISPSMAERLKEAEERVARVQAEVIKNPDLAVEYYLLAAARAQADELLNCDLNGRTGEDTIARIDQYHRYTDVGSALLYRDVNYGGGSKFFTLTWPNFKWAPYKFNDAASSAKAWGVNILFQHTWYGGRRLYLIGLPYVAFPDLRVFDFNDTASSFVSVG